MKSTLKNLTVDLIGLTGVGLVSYGAWLILPAAGFITAGVFILVGVYFNARPTK